jgi:hypothetical protein
MSWEFTNRPQGRIMLHKPCRWVRPQTCWKTYSYGVAPSADAKGCGGADARMWVLNLNLAAVGDRAEPDATLRSHLFLITPALLNSVAAAQRLGHGS